MREFAWMAGVFDVKGKLRRHTTANRATPLFKMVVECSHLEIVKRFCKFTGVRIDKDEAKNFTINPARRNCKDHCPEPHQHLTSRMPTIGRWAMTGAGAITVLHNLLPHFVDDIESRQDWMRQALEYVPPLDPKRRGYAQVARSINRLHLLGWRIPEELLPPDHQ
jgi:hypothetical protein